MNILIADDDPTSIILLESLVKKMGFCFSSQINGDLAWKEIKEKKPEIILLDWNMPGYTGLDLLEIIRSKEYEIQPYVIMITAREKKENIETALNKGADDYITKPFHPGELKARIDAGKRIVKLQQKLFARILDLNNAMSHIKTLQGLLPICMHCHKIRSDQKSWEKIEEYLENHSDVKLSHGICPDCMKKYYGDV